ncbi:MAG: hypothetical protein IKK75_09805 [Clostridia bacterium]|nr:hypothetical protein [Clostridia bacterium]
MASGLMQIRYSDNGIDSAARKAYNELDDIVDSLDKIRRKVNGLPERSRYDNLSNASAFIRKKKTQYENRKEALQTLRDRSSQFLSKVETTEKTLSGSIKKEYNAFHKQTGIGKTMVAAAIEKIGAGIKKIVTYMIPIYGQIQMIKDAWSAVVKIGEAIKTWYNNLPEGVRYLIKTVAAVTAAIVAVIAVVASFGAVAAATGFFATAFAVISAVGAVIGATDAIISAAKSGGTLGMYLSGNKSGARELDAMSTAESVDMLTGGAISADAYNTFTTVGSICSLVGGIGSFATKVQTGASKVITSKSTGKEIFSAYKDSFKTQMGDKMKGLFGMDDLGDLRSYTKENGGVIKSVKTLFTTDLGKLVGNQSQINALKGLKAAYEWFTFEPIGDITGVFNAGSFGGGALEVIKIIL